MVVKTTVSGSLEEVSGFTQLGITAGSVFSRDVMTCKHEEERPGTTQDVH